MIHVKICKTCGKEFTCNRSHKEYCNKKCYKQHPEIKKKYSKRTNEYKKKHAKELINRYNTAKWQSKTKNREFTITFEKYESLLKMGCYYCNDSLLNSTGVGLDRIDNEGGYTDKNILPCCGDCNRVRNNVFTVDETKAMINGLLQFWSEKMLSNH